MGSGRQQQHSRVTCIHMKRGGRNALVSLSALQSRRSGNYFWRRARHSRSSKAIGRKKWSVMTTMIPLADLVDTSSIHRYLIDMGNSTSWTTTVVYKQLGRGRSLYYYAQKWQQERHSIAPPACKRFSPLFRSFRLPLRPRRHRRSYLNRKLSLSGS